VVLPPSTSMTSMKRDVDEGAAADQLHGEERAAAGQPADVVDRHDAGVLQLAAHPCLLDEAAQEFRVLIPAAAQHLDGQVAAQVRVPAGRAP
jgi:hypothetical protein